MCNALRLWIETFGAGCDLIGKESLSGSTGKVFVESAQGIGVQKRNSAGKNTSKMMSRYEER
jgi:hypothetical protein